jgi:hypothetical protein
MEPDDLEDLNPSTARKMYLEDRRGEVSSATLQSHGYRLDQFLEWCRDEGVENLNTLSGRDIQTFKLHRKQQGLAPATLKSQMDTLRVFLRFCKSIDGVHEELPESVNSPSLSAEDARGTDTLDSEHAEQILAHQSKYNYASRKHVEIRVLWSTGMRMGALRGIDLPDVHLRDHAHGRAGEGDVSAVAAENNISKYTPTAQLKASVTENRLYETEDGWQETPPDPQNGGSAGGSGDGPQWSDLGGGQLQEQEVEINSKLVEYACFKGDRETVLQNTALQYPMFEVLCDLARFAEKGTLTAIAAVDDRLEATRIVDGEDRSASIEVIDDPREQESENTVNWRDNKFISE